MRRWRSDRRGDRAATADTSVFQRRQDFRKGKCGGGLDWQRGRAARYLVVTMSAATDHSPAAMGHIYCGRLGETVPTRSDGQQSDRGIFMFMRGARECCFSKRRPSPRGRGEAATKHRGGGSLPHREGSGDMRMRGLRRTMTPHQQLDRDQARLRIPDPGTRSDKERSRR